MNILITNIGRRGYLVDYFREIIKPNEKIYTSDCDKTASGLYGNNDGHFILPKPVDNEKLYVEKLIQTCMENDINAVLPVIDPEIYILSKYRQDFQNKGVTVVVSDRSVLDTCFDKLKMNHFLVKIGVPYPKTYATMQDFESDYTRGNIQFPVVLKPILGSGSVDTYFVDDIEKLKALYKEGMLIQKKLNGVEYGTDTFNSFEGIPLRCVIKKKLLMRSGETDKSVSVHKESVKRTLLKIATELGHIANLDCDVIECDGTPFVIDMNPRFGGGYPATHATGVNLVRILYKMLYGETVYPDFDNYQDDILVMKEIAVRSTVLHGL